MSMGSVELAFDDEVGVFQTTGVVAASRGGSFEIRHSEGRTWASRAVSCLVEPEAGDVVLVAGPRSSALYVVAVLDRPRSGEVRLSAPGDLGIELGARRLRLTAAEGLDLVSGRTMSFVTRRLDAHAREGKLFVGAAKVIAGAMDVTLERLCQTAKRVFRRTTELEHVRAGQIDYASEGNLRMHGENALVTARTLVKADAKQIHIG